MQNTTPNTTNATITLRFLPSQAWLTLGPGWAVLAGFLSTGPFAWSVNALISVGVLWILADPILGTVWDILSQRQFWQQSTDRSIVPSGVRLRPLLPYLAQDSQAYRGLLVLTCLFRLPHGEGYSLLIAVVLALLVAGMLGPLPLAYAITSIALAWLVKYRQGLFWRSLALFLLPYLTTILIHTFHISQIDFLIVSRWPHSEIWSLSIQIFNHPLLPSLLIGLSYTCIYFGVQQLRAQQFRGGRFVLMGQMVAAILLFGLNNAMAGTFLLLLTGFSLLLRLHSQIDIDSKTSACWWGRTATPFLIASLLVATITLGGTFS